MFLSAEIPTPSDLRRLRESLRLSQSELASVLGFSNGGDKVVRDWERGERGGSSFRPTPTAWAAFRHIAILVDLYREEVIFPKTKAYLREMLPECLQ